VHCRGCLPREAEFGRLCNGCHQRLLNMLHTAPAQHRLLLAVVEPSSQQSLAAQPKRPWPDTWRTDSEGPHYRHPPSPVAASEGCLPLRVDAFDTARQIADTLSAWVEMLVNQHELHGPVDLRTGAEDAGGRHGRWRESRWPLRRDDPDDLPVPVWQDPPLRFEISSASRWLIAQLERLESSPGIRDLWGELADVMVQAHALAPWREQAAALKGIECPECHRNTLRLFGGDENVTCTTCRASIPWARYAVWVRELAQRRGEAG
jgi:hypothetical protein